MPGVILNTLEMVYLAGFTLLQIFVIFFPILARTFLSGTSSTGLNNTYTPVTEGGGAVAVDVAVDVNVEDAAAKWEFVPLMATSIYCAVGLVWAYARLAYLYVVKM